MGFKNAIGFIITSLLSISLLFSTQFPVNNVGDAGPGSLREAITLANANIGMDTITFTIAGGSVVKPIQLLSDLPYIQDSLFINGSSDPGYFGSPLIEINANGLAANGLNVSPTAPYTHINALIINNARASGIYVAANHVKVTGCYIGTDWTGLVAASNNYAGINAENVKYLQVGDTGFREGNLISGNGEFGIRLFFSDSTEIVGNKIGTDTNGTSDIANGLLVFNGAGIYTYLSNALTIGGSSFAHRNIISGNHIGINHTGSHAKIYGNFIGTDLFGSGVIANLTVGVIIEGDSNRIGGILAGEGNLISGNTYNGISVSSANSFGNLIQGNHIGTDEGGFGNLPNGSNGIAITGGAKLNTIGGLTAAHRNIISGNAGAGIEISSLADSNYIYNNYIGTDVNGTAALGNGGNGIDINNAKHTHIGNATAAGSNIISSNGANGIQIDGADSTVVKQNYIGTDVSGLTYLANTGRGVFLLNGAFDNEIGGALAADGNIIANNQQGGVEVNGATTIDNSILRNSIYDHPVVGIKLSAGNNMQEAPVLTGFSSGPGTATIAGTFNSAPNTIYRLEFFTSNTAAQGKTFIGTTTITTDGTGAYILNEVLAATVSAAQPILTSTATDPDGNTSPFGVEAVLNSELLAFSAKELPNRSALLNWEITEEQQNIYFEVEHQAPGGEFLKIGEQQDFANRPSGRNYQFNVNNLMLGEHYFRVVQVDQSGHRNYSKSILLNIGLPASYQLALQNPVQAASHLNLILEKEQRVQVSVVDLNGREVAAVFSGKLSAGSPQSIPLASLSQLSTGIYMLRLQAEEFSVNKRIVIN